MAAILDIQQGPVRGSKRNIKTEWRVVNTTIHEENILMRDAFLPIIVDIESLPMSLRREFDLAYERFFGKGMFLMYEHYAALNTALEYLGYEPVILENNGSYFQPTEPGNSKPSFSAWLANADARYNEFEAYVVKYSLGEIDIKQRKKAPL